MNYRYSEVPYASIFPNNETLITYKDLDKACEEIARFNTRDAATYRRFAERAMKMLPMFLSGLYARPSSLVRSWRCWMPSMTRARFWTVRTANLKTTV